MFCCSSFVHFHLLTLLWRILQLEGDDRSDEEEDDSDSPEERKCKLNHSNGAGARGRANGHWGTDRNWIFNSVWIKVVINYLHTNKSKYTECYYCWRNCEGWHNWSEALWSLEFTEVRTFNNVLIVVLIKNRRRLNMLFLYFCMLLKIIIMIMTTMTCGYVLCVCLLRHINAKWMCLLKYCT